MTQAPRSQEPIIDLGEGPTIARAAIVTTLRDAGAVLQSFIEYHLAIGFSRIYLFFDDPSDQSIALARRYEAVCASVRSPALKARWEKTVTYSQNRAIALFVDLERQARMQLNIELAIDAARDDGIDWLLGIDSDELFYSPNQTVEEHFAALSSEGAWTAIYRNHEGIPETFQTRDFFREVSLFKNGTVQTSGATARQNELLGRTRQFNRQFFRLYANGKAAACLAKQPRPSGVHRFKFANGDSDGAWRETNVYNTRKFVEPCILHYPCCGFDYFYTKYKVLGDFSDKLFGKIDIAANEGPFPIEAREAVIRGGQPAAEQFYREKLMFADQELLMELLEADILLRLTKPLEIIHGSRRGLYSAELV